MPAKMRLGDQTQVFFSYVYSTLYTSGRTIAEFKGSYNKYHNVLITTSRVT